ncbi:hypothetical protein SEUCBS139899_000558 [Sporothrix eucalyptigena]|uniref:RING-type domain-containing protein n=1 Tax=Sporothrix eucalyptigena TaxID=1812306 RepID=A0ABP0BFE1_9PEZI
MASAFSAPQAHLSPRPGYDVAFCHGCLHEWYLNEGAASPPPPCPRCQEDIVEIVDRDNDPRGFQQTTGNPLFTDLLMGITGLGSLAQRANHIPDDDDDDMNDDNDPDGHGEGTHGNTRPYHQDNVDRWNDPFSNPLFDHHHLNEVQLEDDDDLDFSDPDVADIDEEEYQGPNNLYMYRTVASFHPESQEGASTPGGPQGAQQPQQRSQPAPPPPSRAPAVDPSNPHAMMETFMRFMNGLGNDSPVGRSGPDTLFSSGANPGNNNRERSQPGTPGSAPNGAAPQFERGRWRRTSYTTNFGTTSFTITTGPPQAAGAGGPGNFNTVFANIMGNVGPPNADGQNTRGAGQPRANNNGNGNGNLPPVAEALQQILAIIINQNANYNAADAVHSDEALDRIVTMLMETNRPNGGAPPATEAALDELERKRVDAKMLEPDGHAECTICISEVAMNDEVVYLPCKHWFHEECVVTWLRQHNTCPVCRTAVTSNNANSPPQAPGSNPAANAAPNADVNANARTSPTDQGAPRPGGPFSAERVRAGGTAGPAGLFNIETHMQAMEEHLRTLHERSINAANRRNQSNVDRLNAIRAAGNRSQEPATPPADSSGGGSSAYPPSTASAAASPGTSSPAGTPSHNPNMYRSSRVPEREAAAERERRRRDSHSPNPGPSYTRTRFTTFSSNPSPSPSERLREQRDQQRQRDREQRQIREQDGRGFENTLRWLGMSEPPGQQPSQPGQPGQQGQQGQGPSASSQNGPQTRTGSGSRGPGHYYWYSTTQNGGPRGGGDGMNGDSTAGHVHLPDITNMFRNNHGDPADDGRHPAMSGHAFPHAWVLHQHLVNVATGSAGGGINTGPGNNNGNGGDPSSGGIHNASPAANNNSGTSAGANNSGSNENSDSSNSGGGGGFFSSLFRGLGGGGSSGNGRRRP